MAKGQGLIGNFKGKLGNTVGYSLKDSNNKQTQGIRVYQPVVRNPKTYAQAEQRCKLAPINATYRALKMVIDRGQEGKAYGNKSRLAWLKDALKEFDGPYFEKGLSITMPVLCTISKGSLAQPFPFAVGDDVLVIALNEGAGAGINTVGALSTAIIAKYPSIQNGDQITAVYVGSQANTLAGDALSIVMDTTSTAALPSFISKEEDNFEFTSGLDYKYACCFIISREGDNGAHLRSNSVLNKTSDYDNDKLTEAAKQAAIESYMSQGANTDWAEESIMG